MTRKFFCCSSLVVLLAAGALSWYGLMPPESERIRRKVTAFCGDCHAFPPPDSFPREVWHDKVQEGIRFYFESLRTDLDVPPVGEILTFYQTQAPVKLVIPPPSGDPNHPGIRFRQESLDLPKGMRFTGVSHLRWQQPGEGRLGSLYFCDMKSGDVRELLSGGDGLHTQVLGKLAHPAHLEPVDWDGDGGMDFIVAELGSFKPADHDKGKVFWLRRDSQDSKFEPIVIRQGLGRVADVRPGDFDGDGDLDLLVAEFGHRITGRILLLKRVGFANGQPEFNARVLDERHGTSHLPVADLNGDGHLDFVALISQEHEVIEVFLNRGDATFQRKQIFSGDDPSFGFSGVELADLDADGDLDVLFTNGDTLDSQYIKPYHAVRWLENRGGLVFEHHLLTYMPGAYRALAADLDGDQDLDVVACSFVNWFHAGKQLADVYDSLIWLEQIGPGKFVRHPLERSKQGHMALELGDFDADGDIDLVAGSYSYPGSRPTAWLTVWWNLSELPPNEHAEAREK